MPRLARSSLLHRLAAQIASAATLIVALATHASWQSRPISIVSASARIVNAGKARSTFGSQLRNQIVVRDCPGRARYVSNAANAEFYQVFIAVIPTTKAIITGRMLRRYIVFDSGISDGYAHCDQTPCFDRAH
jgi:hypothetical protein